MSKSKEYKDSSVYLREMQRACQKINEYVQRTTEKEFLQCLESYDAICMQFSQLGEQVSLLEKHTDKIISHFPDEVDWPAIKALRNRIDHAYATIDAVMIWNFAKEDLAEIEHAVARILKKRYG
ncbi:MAG: DUF86 domain-containing protein [Bdellovibrionaceae bacterium]|nr:DUF86 domain-containing protein [Pseudobdellovibrionaceae bacterium]